MKTIQVYDLAYDRYVSYRVPSKSEALEYSKKTWGGQYDKIEKEFVEGGLPIVFEKLQ